MCVSVCVCVCVCMCVCVCVGGVDWGLNGRGGLSGRDSGKLGGIGS